MSAWPVQAVSRESTSAIATAAEPPSYDGFGAWHVRLGLWSALLGLCSGATGILLNHRATLRLRLPLAETTRSTVQLVLPADRPETGDAFATWACDALAPPGALPTAVGERLVEHARAILAGLDAIRWVANAAHGLERGRVRLSAFPTVVATFLPPLLRCVPPFG